MNKSICTYLHIRQLKLNVRWLSKTIFGLILVDVDFDKYLNHITQNYLSILLCLEPTNELLNEAIRNKQVE